MRPQHWLYTIPLRVRSLFSRSRVEQELSDELQFHLDKKTQQYVSAGLSAEEARRTALRDFDGVEQSKEKSRDTRRVHVIETTLQDIRFGLRMLRKNPGFTSVAVLTLALGIGANAAIFSMVNSFLLRPLPVRDAEQITTLAFQLKNGSLQTFFSFPEFDDLQAQTSAVFSDVMGNELGMGGLTINGKTEPLVTFYVSGNFFSSLGVKPHLGRFILPSEGSATSISPVIVLGYSFWQTHFGGDPGAIGKTVFFDGHPVTIIGVVPKEFHGLYSMVDMQAYLPFGMQQVDGSYLKDTPTNRENRGLLLFARLRSGVSMAQAQAELNVVANRLAKQYPKSEEGLSLSVYPERFSRPQPDPDKSVLKIAVLFLILAGLVLLLACVNVANFLLVRATARQREMAIRTALGGTRLRLIRQLLTESVLLALCGGVAGILLGLAASQALSSIRLGTNLPVLLDFQFDWRVFGYAFAAALVTGVIVGLVPALRASRHGLAQVMREGGRTMSGRRNRLRTALVVVQVGGSLMLLIVAGLMMRSLGHAEHADLGFEAAHVLNLSVDPDEIGYSAEQGLAFYKSALERIGALPGVSSASVAFSVPMGYYNNYDALEVSGYEVPTGTPPPTAGVNAVTPDYFRTMGIPLLEGRAFTDADVKNTQWVAVVNEVLAKKFWPEESALGHEFKMGTDHLHTLRIVGVAKNSRTSSMIGPIREYFYVPFAQQYSSLASVQVRTTFPPETLATAVREQIASLAPTMPVFEVHTMAQGLYTLNGLFLFRFAAGLAGILGALGLILALVGVFGVISFTVNQRTNEIGIRMAMGASQNVILRMILRHGVVMVASGVLAGIVFAVAIAKLVGNFIVGVSPYDPLTYLSVSALLGLVALLACYIPARRATRVDPMVALRYE